MINIFIVKSLLTISFIVSFLVWHTYSKFVRNVFAYLFYHKFLVIFKLFVKVNFDI